MNKQIWLVMSLLFTVVLAGCSDSGEVSQTPDEAKAVEDRIKPVGQVNTGGEMAPSAPAATEAAAPAGGSAKSGKDVYTAACFACHGTGAAGAPKVGDKAAWAPRIAQGIDVLLEHATKGFSSKPGSMMPAKGGNMSLSDGDVKAAIEYMTAQSQ